MPTGSAWWRLLKVLALLSAVFVVAVLVITTGIGPFGSTKVRPLFGASAEALAGDGGTRTKPVQTFAREPEADPPPRVFMPATKSGMPLPPERLSPPTDAGHTAPEPAP